MLLFPKIAVHQVRFFPGATAGLGERTVLLTLQLHDPISGWEAVEPFLRERVWQFSAFLPYVGVKKQDFPTAFVLSAARSGVSTGTIYSFAEWVLALTVVFQRLAHDPVWQGRVMASSATTVRLALPWGRRNVLHSALQFALRCIAFWVQNPNAEVPPTKLLNDFGQWLHAARDGGLSPMALRFAVAARARGVAVTVHPGFVRLGTGVHGLRMDQSFTAHTASIATNIARNKNLARGVLHEAMLPAPAGELVHDLQAAQAVAQKLGWPVVVKPCDLDQGVGVAPGLADAAAFAAAYAQAAALSRRGVIVERHIAGDDFRMLVVGGKLSMTVQRTPGGVTGDAVHTVAQLVEQLNQHPLRGRQKRSMLMAVDLDDEAQSCLRTQGLNAQSIVPAGRFVFLRKTSNISRGGTAKDVSAWVHPDNRLMAERAAKVVGLDIAGIDFLCPDISRSWREMACGICEVNAQPSFRVHWLADPQRDISGEVVDWLFDNKPSRIPLAAITGTNGKSTTAQMLRQIWLAAGTRAGLCSSQGIWIGSEQISVENLSGFPGGKFLLGDPTVEAAIVEMPRKGLLRFGHPSEHYDVAALLNVQDDHIGLDGIDSREQMALLKSQVLERARDAVVVNAEDPLCLAMLSRVRAARHILVARDAQRAAFRAHRAQGGPGVCVRERQGEPWIVLEDRGLDQWLMRLWDIPATLNGVLHHNEHNALFAVAMAWAQGLPLDVMASAMASFSNSVQQNPGRFNFFSGYPFQVLLDYAHNPDAVFGLAQVVAKIPARKKILVCLNLGNRSRHHISATVKCLAAHFDYFILGQDKELVLRCPDYASDSAGKDPLHTMLDFFVQEMRSAGVGAEQMETALIDTDALERGLALAKAGDLLVLMAEAHLALPLLKSPLPIEPLG